jgi:hypothetical protein
MDSGTAEKVALLVLHGAEPMRLAYDTSVPNMWRIVLPNVILPHTKVLAHITTSTSTWYPTKRANMVPTKYHPATWDDMADALASLPWPMIHEFLGTTP